MKGSFVEQTKSMDAYYFERISGGLGMQPLNSLITCSSATSNAYIF